MSEAALLALMDRILNDPNYDAVAEIVEGERARGFRVLRPDDTPWFLAADWAPKSIASVSGVLVRLVLLQARKPGSGAFTRTVAGLRAAGYRPAVIEPTREFAEMLARRGWIKRSVGNTLETREKIWRPRS